MIALGPILILRPWWLAVVPLVVILVIMAARRADGLARWRQIISPAMLAHLRRRGHVDDATHDPRPWLLGAAALCLTLGLAGPATQNPDAPAFRNLDVVMILMDLSPSITEAGGLADAQAAASRLLDRHGTRPVALILYAGESFLFGVPSEETETLQTALAVIAADTMPVTGSRPDRALILAGETLANAGAERADIVLISDGGGLGPDALFEARRLRAGGIRLSAIQITPAQGLYGMAPPDPAALQELADIGGGLVVPARAPGPLVDLLTRQHGGLGGDPSRRAVQFTDHGRWLLLPACLMLLPLFRRRRAA